MRTVSRDHTKPNNTILEIAEVHACIEDKAATHNLGKAPLRTQSRQSPCTRNKEWQQCPELNTYRDAWLWVAY